ncbi:SufS family cysteine desulfurase [Ramlibacter sp.]|uniref:aminotransferase class V-fold PLP-dependent enzyme n=1 Tax=Ramlibacter sp. TaxID=1917967 RepID=UPI002D431D8C|nr:SufS family cysteine desulfurase [Ramlibacter sp.]HYD74609.1 SufS family cysteine desulfurase [Ramlibacter sp.]
MGDRLLEGAHAGQFPGLAQSVHGAPLAYLDNAATTHMPQAVLDAMQAYETANRANIHRGVHTLSQRSTEAFDRARDTLKRFVGAGDAHELVFTSGTTEALNLVAHGLSDSGIGPAVLQPGDEIVTTALEHHANLVPWQAAARRSGAKLHVLRPDSQGQLHVDDLARLLGPRTRVFAVTACANATGERPPFETLLSLAAEAGALTVLDAAQAVSHEVPALSQLECDFMAFSGHKMYGPMGTGALVGRRAALERLAPLRLGGDMVEWVNEQDATFAELPARLEGGTPNVGGAVGMAAAADWIDSIGREAIDSHVRALRAHAVSLLSALKGLRVLSPGADHSAIVSFVAEDAHPHDLGTLLDRRGIAVRTGHHCAQPLLECLGIGPTTRASFAIYNTHEEVERLADAVAHALEVLR